MMKAVLYTEMFGLELIQDNDGNMELSNGLFQQESKYWEQSPRRKPLVLRGARQVGKTWLMKEFGNQCYEKTFYFSFDKEEDLKTIFASNKDPFRIVELLGIIRNDKILPEKHLIIFDEIQECSEALNSLKYFKECK